MSARDLIIVATLVLCAAALLYAFDPDALRPPTPSAPGPK